MARVGSRFPKPYRWTLFAVLATSWISGIAFFIFSRWITVEGDFGPEKHPWQFTVLKIHGGAAFSMMITYGYLLASHVPAGWRTQRHRLMGLVLVGSQGFLIFTAYLLYYIAGDELRGWIALMHAGVGFCFPFLLGGHIYSSYRLRRRSKHERRIDQEIVGIEAGTRSFQPAAIAQLESRGPDGATVG